MITVIELAKRGHVSANVVRYYCREGLLSPSRDQLNGYKLFTNQDLERLTFIRLAQQLGYRLGEIKDLLDLIDSGDDPRASMQEILVSHAAEAQELVRELARMQTRLESACNHWERRGPDGIDLDSLCAYFQSLVAEEPVDAVQSGSTGIAASALGVFQSRPRPAKKSTTKTAIGANKGVTNRESRYSNRLEEVFGLRPYAPA